MAAKGKLHMSGGDYEHDVAVFGVDALLAALNRWKWSNTPTAEWRYCCGGETDTSQFNFKYSSSDDSDGSDDVVAASFLVAAFESNNEMFERFAEEVWTVLESGSLYFELNGETAITINSGGFAYLHDTDNGGKKTYKCNVKHRLVRAKTAFLYALASS